MLSSCALLLCLLRLLMSNRVIEVLSGGDPATLRASLHWQLRPGAGLLRRRLSEARAPARSRTLAWD